MEFPASSAEVDYGAAGFYSVVTFTLHIRRRTLYYFNNLIIPCILIGERERDSQQFLVCQVMDVVLCPPASLAILGFYFPPESGEKVTLEITILMALTFYMNMVANMMPQSSQTPLIGIYFSCIMIMVANSVAVSILILSYHHRQATSYGMPHVIRLLFLQWLPWVLRIDRPGKKITRQSIRMENKVSDGYKHPPNCHHFQ